MDVFPGLAHVLSRTPRLQTVHLYLKGAPFPPESEIRAVSELNLGLKTGLWGFRSGENRLHQLLELRAHARSEELSCVGLAGLLHTGAGRARCITPCLLPFAGSAGPCAVGAGSLSCSVGQVWGTDAAPGSGDLQQISVIQADSQGKEDSARWEGMGLGLSGCCPSGGALAAAAG